MNRLFLAILLLSGGIFIAPAQAGDFSSHIYNSWLAQLVEAGKLSGLVVAGQATNVLFDLMLSGLLRSLGPELAQRIAVLTTGLDASANEQVIRHVEEMMAEARNHSDATYGDQRADYAAQAHDIAAGAPR